MTQPDTGPDLRYAECGPRFGTFWPNGSCNAVVEDGSGETVCGWPMRADGICHKGHPREQYPLAALAAQVQP